MRWGGGVGGRGGERGWGAGPLPLGFDQFHAFPNDGG